MRGVSRARKATCSAPPSVPDADIVKGGGLSKYKPGMKVTYKCKDTDVTDERICLTSGKWSEMGFVCDFCPDGWTPYKKNCYRLYPEKTTLVIAWSKCSDVGATLAAPTSRGVSDVIRQVAGYTHAWIDLNDKDAEGTWKVTKCYNVIYVFIFYCSNYLTND